jgi:putative ABC transport system permease protein
MLLNGFGQDLRYALRSLRTSPGFAAVAILSLALGIGANTAIFSLIDAVMLKYLPVSHPEELLQVVGDNRSSSFTNPLWEQIRDRQDVFSGIFANGTTRFNLANGGEARYAFGILASGSYFSTLGVHPVLGRTFTTNDDQRGCSGQAMLSYDFWQRQYGGSPAVLNRTISLDGHPFPVLGVLQPGFFGVDVGSAIDVYLPICAEAIVRGENSALDHRSAWWLRIVGRPNRGVSPKQVLARLKTLAPGIYAATVPPRWAPAYKDAYLARSFEINPASNGLSYVRTQYRPALLTLMVVVGVVLLIACANVANLLLARATVRQKEIAIRMALGSGRGRVLRQLLTESVLLAALGAALGVLFAQWGSRLLVTFLGSGRDRVVLDLSVDTRVLMFTAAVTVGTGILFGLAPAWRGSRVSPQTAMKENSRGMTQDRSRLGLGKILVIAQVALSLVLLIGAGLLVGTFRRLATMNPGFEPDHVLVVNADLRNTKYPPERRTAMYEEVLGRLRAIPGVQSATVADNTPISGNAWNGDIVVEGFVPRNRQDSTVWFYESFPRLFDTLGMQLAAGRDFDDRDRLGSPLVGIVNQSMANRFFGAVNPVGKIYRTKGVGDVLDPPVEIIGVVKDAKYGSLRDEAEPIVYRAMRQNPKLNPYGVFELRAQASAADLIPSVKTAVEQVNRDLVISFRTLKSQVAESLSRERLLATLSGFFGGLALLLASIGLYGVMSYNVARRRGEIGIRMALGAEQGRVLRMVLREVAFIVGLGLFLGAAVALAAAQLIGTFLYGMNARDPMTIALATVVLAAVAALAGYVPARRASRLEPMAALREE